MIFVTINFNNVAGLISTVESVRNLRVDEAITHIIVDGGSTDGSLEYLRSLVSDISVNYVWSSECDDGIYDALNKGVDVAKSMAPQFMCFLNSGDYIIPEFKVPMGAENFEVLIFSHFANTSGGEIKYKSSRKFSFLNLLVFGTSVCNHQSILIVNKVCPAYNSKYKLRGELDWYFQIEKKKLSITNVESPLCIFDMSGIGQRHKVRGVIEAFQVIRDRAGVLCGLLYLPQALNNLARGFFRW